MTCCSTILAHSFPPEFSATQDVGTGNPNLCTTGQTPKANNCIPDNGSPNFLANGGLLPATGSGVTIFPTAAAARSQTSAFVPDQVVPYTENYTLTIQRQVGHGLTAEIGYVGDRGIHLPTQVQINIQPEVNNTNYLPTYVNGSDFNGRGTNSSTLAAIDAQAIAAGHGYPTTSTHFKALSAYYNPAFFSNGFITTITSYQPYSESNYNGLIASLQGRMKNGLQLQLSYTWSKTMDDATAQDFAPSLTPRRPQNPANVNADYSR